MGPNTAENLHFAVSLHLEWRWQVQALTFLPPAVACKASSLWALWGQSPCALTQPAGSAGVDGAGAQEPRCPLPSGGVGRLRSGSEASLLFLLSWGHPLTMSGSASAHRDFYGSYSHNETVLNSPDWKLWLLVSELLQVRGPWVVPVR